MTSGLGLARATTLGFCEMGAGKAFPTFRVAAGAVVFLGEGASFGFCTLAAPAVARFFATAERTAGLEGLDAFFRGAAGRLLGRFLPTETRDAIGDFAIVRRRRGR